MRAPPQGSKDAEDSLLQANVHRSACVQLASELLKIYSCSRPHGHF